MELMTCTELSLSPLETVDIDFPDLTDGQSAPDRETAGLKDDQYLKAQVKLCRIKYTVTRAISEYRAASTDEIYPFINPCIQELRQWRAEFQASLTLADDGSFTDNVLAIPAMRTIASLLLRYNQVKSCFLIGI